MIKFKAKDSFEVLKINDVFTNHKRRDRWIVLDKSKDTILTSCPTIAQFYKEKKAPVRPMFRHKIESCDLIFFKLTEVEYFLECL